MLRERRLAALAMAPGVALLGREFLNLRGLAAQCAAETGEVVVAELDGFAVTRLVAACASRHGVYGPLVADRPGLAAALSSTLRDLRDAGLPPAALPGEVADLRALYSEVEHALDRLARDGIVDRVGLFRIAARGAPAWLARRGFTRVEVHGATELVGSAGDLIDALAKSLPDGALRFFQPDWGDDHADRLREEWPWDFKPEASELVENPALARDGDVPEGALHVLRARTPRDELEQVAQEVLRLIEAGVKPREILIVARTLEPYAAWLAPIFDGYGIPVTSSLSYPAVAAPATRTWLDALRALGRDLERAPVVRFLDATCERAVARLAERIARVGAVVRGAEDWRAALDAFEGTHTPPELPALRDEIERIIGAREAFSAARSFSEAARIVLTLSADLPGDDARAALGSVAILDAVDREARASAPPTTAELEGALEAALLGLSTPWHPKDDGGVRVLDAIQARALPCAHLFLIGMVHGAWPREVGEDPFLPDRLRETLRSMRQRPVPVRAWALAEERLLLGLLLAQARDHVVISYARADGAGRALAPSGMLRDLPFAARGTDVLSLALTPERDAADFARAPIPLLAGSPAILEAGRALVAYGESTTSDTLDYDGAVGAAARSLLEAPHSPSFIDQLGRCPQQAFFARVLRADELDEPAADALEATEAGNLVHRALKELYDRLFAEGALAAGKSPESAIARAHAILPEALAIASDEQRARVRTRHPAIWESYVALVGNAIRDFVARDLRTLLPAGVVALDGEREIETKVALGSGRALAIKGRVDRILRDRDGNVRVGDYKTARAFGKPVSPSRVSAGTSLQVPIYALAVAADRDTDQVTGLALPVPIRPERDRDLTRTKERALTLEDIRDLSLPVLSELAGLLERGEFPFRADPAECRYCAYTLACRRAQDESHARVRARPSLREWLSLRGDES